MDPYIANEVYFDFKNSKFVKDLKEKHHNVKDKRIILFMKHVYLKKIVNLFQISIIVASTIITFVESLKPHVFLNAHERQTQIVSICLSTYIGIFTAIFKFIKIDDRKEEIYKILQTFNEIETLVNQKIKQIVLLQSQFEDEMLFYEKNQLCVKHEENKEGDEEENFVVNSDKCNKKKIMKRYYNTFHGILKLYEQEEIDKKILDAKKQFHTMFSYNEIIYYKGKIVESMLLERVHMGNRTILEAPMEQYKHHFRMIRKYKEERKELDASSNAILLDKKIGDLKCKSQQIYNEDDYLYSSNWCNNICLYFSNICHFCLVMNLYLSLAIKRSKFRSLKRNYERRGKKKKKEEDGEENKEEDDENKEMDDLIRFLCCRCKAFDWLVKRGQCQNACCCSLPDEESGTTVVYYCCDCWIYFSSIVYSHGKTKYTEENEKKEPSHEEEEDEGGGEWDDGGGGDATERNGTIETDTWKWSYWSTWPNRNES